MQSASKRHGELWGGSGRRLVLAAAVRNRGKAGITAVAEGKHKHYRQCGCAGIAHIQRIYHPPAPTSAVYGVAHPLVALSMRVMQ